MRAFAITGAVLALTACARSAGEPARRPAAPSVSLVTARTTTFVQTVAATGRFGATSATPARLAFAEPGVLAAVPVRLGERVAAGDVVAQLDAAGYTLGARQAGADVGAAVAAQRQAYVDRTSTKIRVDEEALHRAEALYAAGVAPRKEIDAARAELADARAEAAANRAGAASSSAQVESAQARSAIAQRSVAQATLRSPVSGAVVSVLRRAGEVVDAGTPVVVIAPAEGDDLGLLVASPDVARVQTGDLVRYRVVGTDAEGTGRVTGIAPVVDPDAQSSNVSVRTAGARVPAGSLVQATIETASIAGIVLPEAAVVGDPQTHKTLVFVAQRQSDGSQRFEQRDVVVRDRGAGRVLLASGVRAGERIAAQGAFALLAPADGGGD